jgi:hypothetical protein
MRARVATAALSLALAAGAWAAINWALDELARPYCPKVPAGLYVPPQCRDAQGGPENHYSWED